MCSEVASLQTAWNGLGSAKLIYRVCLQTSRRLMSKLRGHKVKAPFVPWSLAFYWHSGSDNWGRKHSNLHHFADSNWPITDISVIATGLKEMYIRGGAYLLSPNNSLRFNQPHCELTLVSGLYLYICRYLHCSLLCKHVQIVATAGKVSWVKPCHWLALQGGLSHVVIEGTGGYFQISSKDIAEVISLQSGASNLTRAKRENRTNSN